VLCDQTTEIDDCLSASIVDSNSCFDTSETLEISDTENAPCDMRFESELDNIKLVHNDEVSAKISQDNSLWSIILDSPISLSDATCNIVELACLKSIYILDFTFNLIGDYGVYNASMVHTICMMCDELSYLVEEKSMSMLNHFDMTSNSAIDFMPNSLLHDRLSKVGVACEIETSNHGVPLLGWFNDKHSKLKVNTICFTYIFKLNCDTCFEYD
jgi:hypothetical protein